MKLIRKLLAPKGTVRPLGRLDVPNMAARDYWPMLPPATRSN